MPTNEERREVAKKLRGLRLTLDVDAALGLEEDASMGDMDFLFYTEESVNRLADLIEPDYTSEESGYFVLPKPKEEVAVVATDGWGRFRVDILEEAARKWAKSIEDELREKLFTTFREICSPVVTKVETKSSFWVLYNVECSKCRNSFGSMFEGEQTAKDFASALPLDELAYCSRCGAKICGIRKESE